MTKRLQKVLVANRGEIAVRIIRALRERGIVSVAVYSEADRDGLATQMADEAHCIGQAPSISSYLQAGKIVDLAVEIGADAIHPGYGFLSENADFARRCEERGVTFIGPSSQAIAAMGSKIESRRLMTAAGVPIVPGGTEPLADAGSARAAAREIGYPVMLKASAGGGGKGMRLVRKEEELEAAFRGASSEAGASFNDPSVYIERFVERPRHVEIQILGDRHGRVVSLGERECSLQRRHQKVVEEAPSPVVDPDLRRRMGEAAVRAAETVNYVGAGTVEFLLDPEGAFYFLEMNTRIQVEHPVTELVTGVDIVAAQLDIAAGEALPDAVAHGIEPRGHAVEVRLYAEDPFRGFAPSPGKIELLRLPEGPGVRNDCGVYEGAEVTIHYDPMLAKLIVWGRDRTQALARLRRALAETRVEGIRTNLALFELLLEDEDFLAGNMDISMLDRKLENGDLRAPAASGDALGADLPVLAAVLAHLGRNHANDVPSPSSGDRTRSNWQLAARRDSRRATTWN